MTNRKKAEIGIEALFYVFMAIIFVWILIFGFQKIFFVQEQLSEQDRIEIIKGIKESIEYCDDPLNADNVKVIEFNNIFFNSMCLIDSNFDFGELDIRYSNNDFVDDINIIKDNIGSKSNIILLKTSFVDDNLLDKYVIIDSEEVETNVLPFCNFDFEEKGEFKVEIIC